MVIHGLFLLDLWKATKKSQFSHVMSPEGVSTWWCVFYMLNWLTFLWVFIEIWNGKMLKCMDLEHIYKPASTVEVRVRVRLLQPRLFTPPIFMPGQCPLPSSDAGNLWSRWAPLFLCFIKEKINKEISAECSSQELKLYCLRTPPRRRQLNNFREGSF